MKYILLIASALIISASGYSQSLYSMDFNMSMTSGETAKYIESTSFRGFTFEGRGFVHDQLSFGGLFSWTTFYDKLGGEEFTYETSTVTGNQYRYINAFPILFQGHYYLQGDEFEPRVYMGGGIGAYKINQRTNIGTWSVEQRNWHFGVSPEVGLLYPVSLSTQFNISFRYHYVFKASSTTDISWFGLAIGLAWGE